MYRPKPTKVEKFADIKRKSNFSMESDGKVNNGSRVSRSFLCSVKQKKTLNGHFIMSIDVFLLCEYMNILFFSERSSSLEILTIGPRKKSCESCWTVASYIWIEVCIVAIRIMPVVTDLIKISRMHLLSPWRWRLSSLHP